MIYTCIYLYIPRRNVAPGKQKGSFMDNAKFRRCTLCGGNFLFDEVNLYKVRKGFNGPLSKMELCAGCAEDLFLDDSDIIEETEG